MKKMNICGLCGKELKQNEYLTCGKCEKQQIMDMEHCYDELSQDDLI